ncbi:serine/threonine-protein kinase [Streptomyces sp. NRRL F-2747]|uniref:serine/threonine-protein kinase n=1 Tax=Streptomyces sp. NRRL F-2747 TaxID=1463843 RepID=UPI000ADD0CEB|nr:serine/threonine-protein kinase [Streptomyces sp. NRRL F-2747]
MRYEETETVTETVLAGTPDAVAALGGERLIAGRYRLLSRLGEGGMGTVWRARDETLQREVAVKEVRPPGGLGTDDIARMYSRLEREAWAAARIPDRHVVTVYDVVMDGDRPWIVMELIRGQSLADLLRAEGPLTPRHTAHIGAEVLGALRAAHAVGVEHRDVKPANVLLAEDGRVVLGDFGIAMVEGSTALTMTGEVVGSPEFLPPERALGRPSGPESDLWSLGVMLYAAVEGISPFRQDTALSTLRAVVDEEPPVPSRAGPLAPVIAGLLRKEPAERTPAAEVAEALRDIARGPGATTTAAPVPAGAARQAAAGTPVPGAPLRRRRTAVLATAGAAACVLTAAGLAYAFTGNDGDAAAGPGLRLSVVGANTTYTGRCPSPESKAPSFTATFTASEPTLISYRWVSGNGAVVDPHWRTMKIGDRATPTGQDTVNLTAYARAGTLTTGMAVELQSPTHATSDPVPFSITCTG